MNIKVEEFKMRINAFIQVLIFFSALVLMLSGVNFQLTAGENQKRIEYPPAKHYNVTTAVSKVIIATEEGAMWINRER